MGCDFDSGCRRVSVSQLAWWIRTMRAYSRDDDLLPLQTVGDQARDGFVLGQVLEVLYRRYGMRCTWSDN